MLPIDKPRNYSTGCNEALLKAIAPDARHILEVGCGEGNLGRALKEMNRSRKVLGIERQPALATKAAENLDQVFTLDVEQSEPPIPAGSLDCIIFGDILEHLVNPELVLRRYRRFLGSGGVILCSVANVQHHSVIAALLRSDFPYSVSDILDGSHLRFFTYSTIIKLVLDSGFVPVLLKDITIPYPADFRKALQPLLDYLGLHPDRTARYLSACQYVVKGIPISWPTSENGTVTDERLENEPAGETPLTFVVCVSDDAILNANLLSSPCFGSGSPHEVIPIRNCHSAAQGLNEGIRRARHHLVVCVHQDVYLPRGWPKRLIEQYQQAERAFGPIGVAGVYGVARAGTDILRAGQVIDRDQLLAESTPLPALVDTLDELLLVVPRGTPLAFDPRLGFHLYGADICLSARQHRFSAVALDTVCFHHSRAATIPRALLASAEVFRAKWSAQLPIATPAVYLDAEPRGRRP